jgi:hypothetical protein
MAPFTLVHVIVSLVAIAAGFIVLAGLLGAKPLDSLTAVFLITTVATSVTGFFLPAPHLLPSHVVGIISLVLLTFAVLARYPFHMQGRWRSTYVITAMASLYLNVFVLIVQSFLKIDALKALAPTQTEPPFAIAQGAALAAFVVLTILAVRKFKPQAAQAFTARAGA